LRLLLDENVSPSIVQPLLMAGHDVYHVRDRGLIGRPDHVIWRRAVDEDRVLVTINARDFVRLAQREALHGGLLTFPSGARPTEQLTLVLQGLEHLAMELARGQDVMNRWLDVAGDGEIRTTNLSSSHSPD
jgi:predicted nuclease of predicted toxin-antitoxin system